ncbi:rRNA cytosine-C5-methylase, partial [Ameyamaea chiangmaiensis]|nr:rRNA cytosine-C5-methylase [Ameyamaea chiangmaiensis]
RRHPDVLWVKRPRDVTALAEGQAALIAAARDMLRPGGRLIYAVCSLQDEEGPAQMRHAVTLGLVPDPFTAEDLPGLPEALTPEGWVRTSPALWRERGGMDGFFIGRLRRV